MVLSNRPTPFCERTDPQIPIMFGPDQVPPKIEQIGNGGVSTQKPLSLPH